MTPRVRVTRVFFRVLHSRAFSTGGIVDGGPILAAAKPAASKDQKDLCRHCSVPQDDPLKELLIFVASMAAGGQVAGQL